MKHFYCNFLLFVFNCHCRQSKVAAVTLVSPSSVCILVSETCGLVKLASSKNIWKGATFQSSNHMKVLFLFVFSIYFQSLCAWRECVFFTFNHYLTEGIALSWLSIIIWPKQCFRFLTSSNPKINHEEIFLNKA